MDEMDNDGENGRADRAQGDVPSTPGLDCLLPYDEWTETALRQVVASALRHVGRGGLPGDHHFYLTFRTDHPRAIIPQRVRAQYPHDINVILQHQFWDLHVDDAEGRFSVGVSFGGAPCTLVVPLEAITYFADPHVGLEMRFRPAGLVESGQDNMAQKPEATAGEPEPGQTTQDAPESGTPQVVSLDAFRRRSTPKD